MITSPALITVRPIVRPQYASAPDLDTWLRVNHEVCWQYWVRCEQELGSDAYEQPGAFAEFHDFALAQYDLACLPTDDEDDEEDAPRSFRSNDERDAHEAGVRARGEI